MARDLSLFASPSNRWPSFDRYGELSGMHPIRIGALFGFGLVLRLNKDVRRAGISGRSVSGIRRLTPGKGTESLASGIRGTFIDRPALAFILAVVLLGVFGCMVV